MRTVFIFALAMTSALPGAHAQTFPADDAWRILECGLEPSWDPVRDEPGATNDRDVVGDSGQPAAYIFADAEFLYFRLRVDADPGVAGDFSPFGWGVELDTDGVRTSYELLGEVDGNANPDEVLLGLNTNQSLIDDPADPIEQLLTTYPALTHARALLAEGTFASAFGGDDDYFVDWALAFVDLEAEGVDSMSELVLVLGTSANTMALDADLMCHDGGTGDPTLSAASTDAVRPDGVVIIDTDGDGLTDTEEGTIGTDPNVADTDGDGFDDGVEVRAGTDPNDPNSFPPPASDLHIRGGPGGCAAARDRVPSPLWLSSFVVVLLFVWRRRPRTNRTRCRLPITRLRNQH